MSDKGDKEISLKLVFIGDSIVGKTCIIKQCTENTFQDAYLSTIGFDFKTKVFVLKNGKHVRIQLWDTAGQERFKSIAKSYYRGAHGIVLVYDITNRSSFENINKWMVQISEETENRLPILLLANKVDLDDIRTVSVTEGEEIAKKYGLTIFETSAKENINIEASIKFMAEKMYEIYENKTTYSKLKGGNNTNKKGCC